MVLQNAIIHQHMKSNTHSIHPTIPSPQTHIIQYNPHAIAGVIGGWGNGAWKCARNNPHNNNNSSHPCHPHTRPNQPTHHPTHSSTSQSMKSNAYRGCGVIGDGNEVKQTRAIRQFCKMITIHNEKWGNQHPNPNHTHHTHSHIAYRVFHALPPCFIRRTAHTDEKTVVPMKKQQNPSLANRVLPRLLLFIQPTTAIPSSIKYINHHIPIMCG